MRLRFVVIALTLNCIAANASCPDFNPPKVPSLAEAYVSDLCKGTPYEVRVEELKRATPEEDARHQAALGQFRLLQNATPFSWEGHICTVPYGMEYTVECSLKPIFKPQTHDREAYGKAFQDRAVPEAASPSEALEPPQQPAEQPVQCVTVFGALLADYRGRYNKTIVVHSQYPYKDICRLRKQDQGQAAFSGDSSSSQSVTEKHPELKPAQYSDVPQAARFGDVEAIKKLVKEGSKLDLIDDFRLSALDWAVIRGYPEVIEVLKAEDRNSHLDYCGALRYALEQKRDEIAEQLLSSCIKQTGAKAVYDRATLINTAASSGRVEILRTLVQAGAPLSGERPKYFEPDLDWADADASEGPPKHTLFADNEALVMSNICPLHLAARAGHKGMVDYLLSLPMNADEPCAGQFLGRTAINWAIRSEQLDTLDILLNHGASLRLIDPDVPPVLHYAIRVRNEEILKTLMKHGADIHALDENGFPLLFDAERYSYPPWKGDWRRQKLEGGLDLALAIGADPNQLSDEPEDNIRSDEHPNRSIHLPGSSHRSVLMHLIATTEIIGQNYTGHYSPGYPLPAHLDPELPMDAKLSCLRQIRVLLAMGANPKLADTNGYTALHYVAHTDYGTEVAQVLLDAGAIVNAKDINGQTPLDHALELRLEKIPVLLKSRGGMRGVELP
jgi:ankyrin repeat protein